MDEGGEQSEAGGRNGLAIVVGEGVSGVCGICSGVDRLLLLFTTLPARRRSSSPPASSPFVAVLLRLLCLSAYLLSYLQNSKVLVVDSPWRLVRHHL